jgi:putative ABC transport system ATP-binding protein
MASTIVSLEKVNKYYGDGETRITAVSDVTLELRAGRMVVLMGPSGSGKTTLLTMMGCLLRPSSGTIRVFGYDVTALKEKELPFIRRRFFGFIFQSFNLFPALTAAENVEIALDLKGRSGKQRQVSAAELLEKVSLTKRMHHLPADLSGGEKQRVAIARALAGNPPIILADEPTGQLDSKNGRLVVTQLKELAQSENRLVVIVSHDNRILDWADQVLWMEDGQLRSE